jgi:hypothetical protein
MADPLIRNGVVIIEQAEFTKSHGAAPSRASITTEIPSSHRIDDILWLIIGTSQWMGRCNDVRLVKNESTGLTSQISAVDFRDDLFSVTVFGQINMLDRETGKVYSIVEGIPDPDVTYSGSGSTTGLAGLKGQFSTTLREDITRFREKLRNDIQQFRNEIYNNGGDSSQISYFDLVPEFFRSADPNGFILQTPYYGRIPAGTLIQWLAGLCGFHVEYSSESQVRINLSDSTSWESARWNVFNLDWGTGTKVANALSQVLDALGLQFTMRMDWTRTLYVTRVGEIQYPGLIWEGVDATATEDGFAVQDDADTGVWVVGDRDMYEFTDLPYEPDWNQKWNELFWDIGGLAEKAKELDLDLRTARVRDMPEEYQEYTSGEDLSEELAGYAKHLNGTDINDMLVTEYLKTIPFRLYRIKGMDKVLTIGEEYSGKSTPREVPIASPLLSDPNKQAILKSHWCDEELLATLYVLRVTELSEQEKGWTLIEPTGQIWFDEGRFQYLPAADTLLFDELLPEHIIPEDGTITAVFYGPIYRRLFGTNQRIGSQSVTGLRRGFILADFEDDIANAEEYVVDGERSADVTAEDIAAAYLARMRVVRSGSEEFVGTAGHEVSGEIQRTTVSVSEGEGIKESVQYANDEPSPAYDPQLELRRRLSDKALQKASLRQETDRRDRKLRELYAASDKEDPKNRITGKEQRAKWGAMMGARAGMFTCSNTARGTDSYLAGQPIIAEAEPKNVDPKPEYPYKTIAKASVTENDDRVVGIAGCGGDGHLMVVTHGCYPAYVKGPITRGDALKFSKTDWCFIKGDAEPPVASADEDYAETTVVRKMVRVGSSRSAESLIRARVATTASITLSGTQTIDGQSIIADDIVLVKDQNTGSQNGVWKCKATAWERYGTMAPGLLVVIRQGTAGAKKLYELTTSGPITEGSTTLTFEQCGGGGTGAVYGVAAATTADITLSGAQTIDTVSVTAGAVVLVKNQATASQNGIYTVATGAWAKIVGFVLGDGTFIFVRGATTATQACLGFYVSGNNEVTALGAVYK